MARSPEYTVTGGAQNGAHAVNPDLRWLAKTPARIARLMCGVGSRSVIILRHFFDSYQL
jgi:hypothetical protein